MNLLPSQNHADSDHYTPSQLQVILEEEVSVGHGITHIHEIRPTREIIDVLTADWR